MFFKNQKGMSLIEVTVAIFILGIITFPLINLFRTGNIFTANARHEVAAMNFARAIVEEIRGTPNNQLGAVKGATINTITLESRTSSADDYYNNYNIAITGGTGSGQVRKISGYNGSLHKATVDSNWVTIPDTTSTYIIYKYYPGGYNYRVDITENLNNMILKTIEVTVYYQADGQDKEVCLTTEKLER